MPDYFNKTVTRMTQSFLKPKVTISNRTASGIRVCSTSFVEKGSIRWFYLDCLNQNVVAPAQFLSAVPSTD
jgi:hypothetical protein